VFRRGVALARRACLARAAPGQHWLDVGCGTGHLAGELAAAGLVITGIDHDAAMIRAARARLGGSAAARVNYEVALAERLPIGDGAAHGVVATSLLGCIAQPRSFFHEVHRVLRPGGIAVMTFTNRASVLHAFGGGIYKSAPRGYLPVRAYTQHEAVRDLSDADLEVIEVRYYNFHFGIGRRAVPGRLVAGALERALRGRVGAAIGRNFLVVAAKPATSTDIRAAAPSR
jgi:2-polyprenyl-3-methyl-5-hydroxy-6-metoxy-1,4-benzoquinol methylase